MSNEPVVVAVDGPAASGKSTVSRLVALALDFTYVDSGSFYRGLTWKVIRAFGEMREEPEVMELLNGMRLDCFVEDRAVRFRIDDDDPGQQIRSEPVREHVSDLAAMPEVRRYIVDRLREMTRFGSLVMEGRDIGSVVFPEALFKFYLDADPLERARRRSRELESSEGEGNVEAVMDSLARRDRKDSTRASAPLQIPLGAVVIDSTAMRIEDVVSLIVKRVRGHRAGA